MFTGIVQARGQVRSMAKGASAVRLNVDLGDWEPTTGRPALGDSVCVSGVCLTVVDIQGQVIGFDVIHETIARTTLSRLQAGSMVNLETAVTPATPLGGHFMQGHVDGTARVTAVAVQGADTRVTIEPDPITTSDPADVPVEAAMDAIIPKGSIAVDGISLTVAAVDERTFQVALIPATLDNTTMGRVKPGDVVNLELDIISKTVVHWLTRQHRK